VVLGRRPWRKFEGVRRRSQPGRTRAEFAPPRGEPIDVGRWAYDSIALVGDTDDNWLRYNEEFADIEADVILLVYAYDGFEDIASAAEAHEDVFVQLCHMVVTRQALELEPHMKQKFGTNFRQRYKDYCRQHPRFKPKDVAFPRGS
jgi:hypothetical protein